jgi:Ca2+-binding EF-hand superfamily protein
MPKLGKIQEGKYRHEFVKFDTNESRESIKKLDYNELIGLKLTRKTTSDADGRTIIKSTTAEQVILTKENKEQLEKEAQRILELYDKDKKGSLDFYEYCQLREDFEHGKYQPSLPDVNQKKKPHSFW